MLFPYYVLQETWPVMLEVVSLGKDTAPRKIYILSSAMTFLCLILLKILILTRLLFVLALFGVNIDVYDAENLMRVFCKGWQKFHMKMMPKIFLLSQMLVTI